MPDSLRLESDVMFLETTNSAPRPVALVVDPDDLARQVAAEIAVAAGFDVHPASCGDEAVTLVMEQGRVDVLLVATDLPEMPGEELADSLSKDFPEMRFVVLLRPEEDTEHTRALRKPFTREELVRSLDPEPAAVEPAARGAFKLARVFRKLRRSRPAAPPQTP